MKEIKEVPKFDYLLYIGRFQPPHKAHIKTIEYALTISKNLIVIIGSDKQPRTPKNPWNFMERKQMIINSLERNEKTPELVNRIFFTGCVDYIYNDQAWLEEIHEKVNEILDGEGVLDKKHDLKIGIIGSKKDSTSYYLNMFPQWEQVEMENIEGINATDIRTLYFEEFGNLISNDYFLKVLSPYTYTTLTHLGTSEDFKNLKFEYDFIKKFKSQFQKLKYPPTFNTVDAVLILSGYILLVKRNGFPGKGQWALPGGYVNANETLLDSMIRELREETKLKLPIPVLRGSIKEVKTFDAPARSLRGRIITQAYYMELAWEQNLKFPEVKGSSDAKEAKWIPLSDLKWLRNQIFEDHMDIISYFTKI